MRMLTHLPRALGWEDLLQLSAFNLAQCRNRFGTGRYAEKNVYPLLKEVSPFMIARSRIKRFCF